MSSASDIVLNIENLSVGYLDSPMLFRGLSLELKKKEIIGITGPSGCGKSSLLKAIAKHLDDALITRGKLNLNIAQDEIAYIFQNSEDTLNPIRRLKAQLADVHPKLDVSNWREKFSEIELKPFDKIYPDYPFENSGGQNQRIAWLLSFKEKTKLILADEPVASLDYALKGLLAKWLKEKNNKGLTGLIVSHDIEWLDGVCDHIYQLTSDGLVKIIDRDVMPVNDLETLRDPDREAVLRCENLSYNYGNAQILHALSIELFKGEFLGIYGQSGVGKTTLLKILAGRMDLQGGNIKKQEGMKIAFVGQNALEEFDPIYTIKHNLKYHSVDANSAPLLNALVEDFKLKPELLNQYPDQLSGGELQRLAIIKHLINEPDVMLFDESFAGVDDGTTLSIFESLRKYKTTKDISLILVMHRQKLLSKICDRVTEIK